MKSGMIDRVIVGAAFLLLLGAGTTWGELVEVPLDCAGHYEWLDTWTGEFDLGLEFVSIQSVYIEWSGQITAEVAEGFGGEERARNAQFVVDLYDLAPEEAFAQATVLGGEATHPAPEPFEEQTAFAYLDYSDVLDGQAYLEIRLTRTPAWEYTTLEYPSGDLFAGKLCINGVVVAEPASVIMLLWAATYGLRRRRRESPEHI